MNELAEKIDALTAEMQHLRRAVDDIRMLVGPFAATLPDGSVLVQTIYGNKYFIDSTDEIMAPQLIVYRQWEEDISRFIINSMTPDTGFLDIGANFGYFTCLAASRIGTSGCGFVISVEANPRMVDLLRRNSRINWSMCPITIHDFAVSDREGYIEFNVPDGRAANAGLASPAVARAPGDRRLVVPTRTLPQLVGDRPIDLMKIDVEGFELLVLNHLAPVLVHSPDLAIIMEWSQQQMQAAGFSAADFFALLDRFGYSVHRIPPSLQHARAASSEYAVSRERVAALPYDNVLLLRNGTA